MKHYNNSEYIYFDSERSETWYFRRLFSEDSLNDSTSRDLISYDQFQKPQNIIIDIIYPDEALEGPQLKYLLKFPIGSHLVKIAKQDVNRLLANCPRKLFGPDVEEQFNQHLCSFMTKHDLKYGVSALFTSFGGNVFIHRKLLRIGALPIDCEDSADILIDYSYYCTKIMKTFEFKRGNGKMNWKIGKVEAILSNSVELKVPKEEIKEESEIRKKQALNEENHEEPPEQDNLNLLNQTEEGSDRKFGSNIPDLTDFL